MAIDPGIPLSALQFRMPSPEEQLQQRAGIQQIAKGELELKNIAQTMQRQQKLLSLWQQPGMVDPQTGVPTPQYIAAASGIDADAASRAGQMRQDYFKTQAETNLKNIDALIKTGQWNEDVANRLREAHVEQFRAFAAAYKKVIDAGGSHEEAQRAGTEARLNAFRTAKDEGRLVGASEERQNQVMSMPVDINMVQGELAAVDASKAKPDSLEHAIAMRDRYPKGSPDWKIWNQAVETRSTHQPTVTLAYPQQPSAEGEPPKPPMAVTLAPGGKATVQPLPPLTEYGPKPPSSAQSAMTQRFTDRMVTAADLGIKDLQNISQLPVTISSGVFGGRKQGPGLLDATKEVLANKMTSEETQLYNTMAAGIQRNLAAIEATGLMPSGTLQHMMDVMLFKEGDTNLVKASKLAQARQIIEGGLEPILAKPNVPVETKDLIRDMTKKLRQAVPYTQNDVIKLMNSTDPSATLGGFMKGRREGAKGFQGSPDYQKRQKRIQEIDELLKQHEEDSKRVMEAEKKQRTPAKAGFGQSPDGSVTFEPAQ